MVTALRVNHVNISIPKGREDECTAFYEGVLGLRRAWRPDEIRGPGVWYEIGGEPQLHIGYTDNFSGNLMGNHFAIEIDDRDGLIERLKSHGIEIEGPNHMMYDNSDRLFCRDPFGNRLEFIYYRK